MLCSEGGLISAVQPCQTRTAIMTRPQECLWVLTSQTADLQTQRKRFGCRAFRKVSCITAGYVGTHVKQMVGVL